VNESAWEQIFEKYNILDEVKRNEIFFITAEQIKEFREPRLMTKFDSQSDLPSIFSDNNLAILPTKRGTYVIGKFKNYEDVLIDNSLDVETVNLPDYITTIDYKNITSEAISLTSAYISGMIQDIVQEEVVPTIQGRMGTGSFKYDIAMNDGKSLTIEVENSQMEIDGSYEGVSKFVIVEAKNHYMSDFIVRQLYYPYRVWKNNTDKEIIPVMLIKHDNIYNFYLYEFIDDNNYNSIKLKKIKRYILGEVYNAIELNDIYDIVNNVQIVDESPEVPFPQADSFYRVLDFINSLGNETLKVDEIAEKYEFDIRQGSYYSAAARYLGLVKSEKGYYSLSDHGKQIMKMNHKQKNLEIVKTILSHRPFYYAFTKFLEDQEVNREELQKVILESCPKVNSDETAKRRSQTVMSWIKWIVNLTATYENNPFDKEEVDL
jgi:hypothetical protein